MTAAALAWPARMLLRACLSGLAVTCFVWSIGAFAGFWTQSGIAGMAEQILQGQTFRPDAIRGLLAEGRTPPLLRAGSPSRFTSRPDHLRNLAVLEMALAEQAAQSSEADLLAVLPRLQRVTLTALQASPGDPFLWLMLFWAKSASAGVTSNTIPLLQRSYELGANEGWIALKRIRLSLASLQSLPPSLGQRVMAEFRALVASGFELSVAEILAGCEPATRQRLVDTVVGLPEVNRRKLAENLVAKGLHDLAVPGIERTELRPWM